MRTRFSRRFAELVILLAAMSGAKPAAADTPTSPLDAYLERCGQNYGEDEQMLGLSFSSPGYHTTVPDGTWVHPTRQSLEYAGALLARGETADVDRACKIVRKVLTLQDTDPSHRTYGIWPWLLEEPLEKMSPPDWNWADFCGARIATMLVEHKDELPDDLIEAMRESLGHAARAIRKRNVGPNYTNIAIMGGGVCSAAGEILDDADMLRYGRERLQGVVKHAEHHGGFNEYNSPTYTTVALWESERTLQLVRDPETREAAETLRQMAWQTISDSFNPGTQQWAGPHSRAYSDHVRPHIARYLADQTGVDIRPHPSLGAGESKPRFSAIRHLPCPEQLRERFRALPEDPLTIERSFVRNDSETTRRSGVTWHTVDACLGSVNRSMLWTQRHPLIGYWKTREDPAVVLRLRFLHDGRDFASMGVKNQQRGPRVLSVFYTFPNRGDWHPSLDRPKDGVFHAADFRVRYELAGKGVRAEKLGDRKFALIAGDRRIVIHTPPGRFAGSEVVWQLGEEDDRVYLDGICYHGDRRPFDFRDDPPEITLAAGIELLRVDEPPLDGPPVLGDSSRRKTGEGGPI